LVCTFKPDSFFGSDLLTDAVTVEEPVWESFSEDEPAPPPKKKPALSSAGSKGKKTGQGNIMSFFSKK